MKKTLRIAHRGGAGLWPENTLEAFAHSIASGADGIELDVHLTRDHVLVVHHDENLNLAIARDAEGHWLHSPTPLVKTLSFLELQEYDVGRLKPDAPYAAYYPGQMSVDGARIPSLESVYALARNQAKAGFRLYVELKTALLDLSQSAMPEELAEAAVVLTQRMRMEPYVTFVSFDWRALVHAKRLAPDIPNAFTTLPFFKLDPADPSAANDTPEDARYRAASAAGADFMAGFDWREQQGASFAERMLKAIAKAPADGWFAWAGDVDQASTRMARALQLELSCWTVNKLPDMQKLAALEVDAILTDRPDLLDKALS